MTLCSGPFLAVIAMVSLFSSSWDFPYLTSSESHRRYPQSRFSIRSSLWSGFGDFSNYFNHCYCPDRCCLSGVSPLQSIRTLWKWDSYHCLQGLQSPLSSWVGKVRVPWEFGPISLWVLLWLLARSRWFSSLPLLRSFCSWLSCSCTTNVYPWLLMRTAFVDGLPVRTMSILFNGDGVAVPTYEFQQQELFWYRPL